MTPRERRIEDLRALRARVDMEITALQYVPPRRRSRLVKPDCGTESAYQRHRHLRDTATEGRTVTCDPCLAAHRDHEKARAARARIGWQNYAEKVNGATVERRVS